MVRRGATAATSDECLSRPGARPLARRLPPVPPHLRPLFRGVPWCTESQPGIVALQEDLPQAPFFPWLPAVVTVPDFSDLSANALDVEVGTTFSIIDNLTVSIVCMLGRSREPLLLPGVVAACFSPARGNEARCSPAGTYRRSRAATALGLPANPALTGGYAG